MCIKAEIKDNAGYILERKLDSAAEREAVVEGEHKPVQHNEEEPKRKRRSIQYA